MARSLSGRSGTGLGGEARPLMRTVTLASMPYEIAPLEALGTRAVVVPLPSSPASEPRAIEFVKKAGEAGVEVSFVVGDVARVVDLSSWDTSEGRALLAHARTTILVRRTGSLEAVRRICGEARLAVGPWPVRGGSSARLRDLGVGSVWAGRWAGWQAAREWVDRACAEGFEAVVPVPREAFVDAAYDDATDWRLLIELLSRQRTSWALGVRADLDLEARCGLLMEVKTLLATKSPVPMDAAPESTDAFPYAQTEGFPQLYAELIRHPPAIDLAPGRGADALAVSSSSWPDAPPALSVYVHVPFCVKRCGFCFCASHGVRGEEAKRLRACVDALCAETDLWAASALLRNRSFHTFYMGGGSPSALPPALLSRVIEHVRRSFRFVDDPVISIEMAPSSTSAGKLAAAFRAGANRLSFGAQSFSDHTLTRIGAAHDRKLLVGALRMAREAGFEDLDIDLIYGTPGQGPDDLLRDIDDGIEAGASSIMLFPLQVTPSLLTWWARQGWPCRVWSASRYHDFWDRADRHLAAAGFVRFGYSHYKREMSSGDSKRPTVTDRCFSRYSYVMPGSDGQVAIGPTALGCVGHRQYENSCGVDAYVQQVNAGHLPVGRMTEPQPAWPSLVWSVIEMGACPGVIDEAELSRRFGAGVVSRISGILEPMVARGLFDRTEGGFRTTRTGAMWMANVQSEILREAGLPSPIGHRIRH